MSFVGQNVFLLIRALSEVKGMFYSGGWKTLVSFSERQVRARQPFWVILEP